VRFNHLPSHADSITAMCSSDAWVGDVEASPDTFNMAFRGQRIVAAALALTVSKFGMGSTAGQRLLFAGCSAGSRGAMFTIDYLPAMLHDLGVPTANLQVQGMFDSPMWVDVEPITGEDGPIVPLQEQTQAILELVNATGRLGPTCQVAFPPAEWWKCLYGQYRLPFVETPYAMNAAQFDKFQLPYNEGGNPPYNAAGLAYASNFQDAVRSALAPLPTSEQPGSAVYSAACFHHCVTQEPSYWAIHVYNVSFRDLTAAWYFQNDAPLKYVEQCDGFKCGTCRSHRKHPGAPPDPRPKPPRAPAPPDPFAIWSPPPPVTLAAGSILPRVRSTSTVSATAAKHRADVMRWVVLFAVLLGVLTGYTFISRRTRRLRAIPTPGWSEGTEGMPLIPNRGGVGRGGGAASAAVSSFRSDTRYAKPPGSGGAALSVPDEMVRGPLPAPTAPAGRPLGRSPSAGRYTGRR
jgi:Pectinacetylesterase